MQYAVLTAPDGHTILIDATEYEFLTTGAPVTDEPFDESQFIWKLAYGAFKPQPEANAQAALAQLRSYAGAGFGRVLTEGVCRLSEVRDFEFGTTVTHGQAVSIPCAVLLGGIDELPPANRKHSLALFPRFLQQFDVLNNIVNRPGILALRGEERKARTLLNPDPGAVDWRTFINGDRMQRIGASIY